MPERPTITANDIPITDEVINTVIQQTTEGHFESFGEALAAVYGPGLDNVAKKTLESLMQNSMMKEHMTPEEIRQKMEEWYKEKILENETSSEDAETDSAETTETAESENDEKKEDDKKKETNDKADDENEPSSEDKNTEEEEVTDEAEKSSTDDDEAAEKTTDTNKNKDEKENEETVNLEDDTTEKDTETSSDSTEGEVTDDAGDTEVEAANEDGKKKNGDDEEKKGWRDFLKEYAPHAAAALSALPFLSETKPEEWLKQKTGGFLNGLFGRGKKSRTQRRRFHKGTSRPVRKHNGTRRNKGNQIITNQAAANDDIYPNREAA